MTTPEAWPIRRLSPTAVLRALILVGFGLIALGVVFPWVDKDLPVQVYVVGMESGLERMGGQQIVALAGLGVLVFGLQIVRPKWQHLLYPTLVLIGGLVGVITVISSPLTGSWMPAVGVYMTLIGSFLVVICSGLTVATTTQIDASPITPSK